MVVANTTYPCPMPFDEMEYPAYSCYASIDLPDGLELAQEEQNQHSLGNMSAASSLQTSWRVHARTGGEYNISVSVLGMIEGKLGYPPYKYCDYIGGKSTGEVTAIHPSGYELPDGHAMLIIAGATLAIVAALLVVTKKLRKSK